MSELALQDGEHEPGDGGSAFAPPRFPSISDERALAAKEDPQARQEVAQALFGTWPLPAGSGDDDDEQSVATLCACYLGRWIRHFFPEAFDDRLVAAALRFIAEEFEPRLIGKFKRDRGSFGDWVRLTVSDLATQEGIRRVQHADALVATLAEAAAERSQRDAAAEAALAVRQAVQQLIWVQFFFVDPDSHPPGELRLCRAAGWVKDIFDAARIEIRLDECEALSQEFFMGKILERNILRLFDPSKRSSFIQWLKTAVQNYARDKLTQAASPPVLSLSDALHASSRDEATQEEMPGYGDAPPASYASDAAPVTPEAPEWEGLTSSAPLTVPASGTVAESLDPVIAVVLPAILADELQQALLKLFFGLTQSEADLIILARERLARWGVHLCLEALGIVRSDPGEALDVPGLAEAKQRLREAAALADIESAAEPVPEARELSEAQAAALERYGYAALTHTTGPAPALAKTLKDSPLAERLDGYLELMRRVLMALEHLPAADGGPSVLLATKEALAHWLEEARTQAGLEEQEFQSRALRTVNQRQTKLRHLEAKQRQLEPGSAEWHELDERIAEVRKALRSKAAELRKRTFGPSDADLGRLLGLEPGSVAGIKSRMLRSVREFLDAQRLAEQRRKLAEPLRKRAGEALVQTYEARLNALAHWRAFPTHATAVARLLELAPAGTFDEETTAQQYRALEQQSRHATTGEQASAAQASLDELTGTLLGRAELEAHGLPRAQLLTYERDALRLFTALVALQELAGR